MLIENFVHHDRARKKKKKNRGQKIANLINYILIQKKFVNFFYIMYQKLRLH